METNLSSLSFRLRKVFYALCLLYYIIGFTVAGPITGCLFIYISFTKYYYISLLYGLWLIYDYRTPERDGRSYELFRNLSFWKFGARYFPMTLIKTAELDPNKNYICGYHPHGVLSFGNAYLFGMAGLAFEKVFPGMTPHICTIRFQFVFPVFREQVLAAGARITSKESLEWILTKKRKGNAISVVIGGVQEALEAKNGKVVLVLKQRKGFVKMALKHGASLVPVFAFGENETYQHVEIPENSLLKKLQRKIKSFANFTIPIVYGIHYSIFPFSKPINVVVGKPIDVEATTDPSEMDIDILHEKYVDAVRNLYEEHKSKYAPDIDLHII